MIYDFTIVTPSYNQGNFIADCIESIVAQQGVSIEHIIIDGGSTDTTAETVERYLHGNDRNYYLKFISEPDFGPADAINKGFSLARGMICCWLNSDDFYFSSDVLSKIKIAFEKHPSANVLTGDGYYVSEDGGYVRPIYVEDPWCLTISALRRRSVILQPSTFWRSHVHQQLNLDYSYCFDWDLWVRFAESGMHFLYIREYFSCYRLHDDSLTFQDTTKRKLEVLGIILRLQGSYGLKLLAIFVYSTYLTSDLTGLNVFRRIGSKANAFVSLLTSGRVSVS